MDEAHDCHRFRTGANGQHPYPAQAELQHCARPYLLYDRCVLTPNDTNVALSPPISYDLTPTKLTTLRDSLNAWHGMTAGEVLADVSVADGFGLTKQIYAADGSIVSPDTPASGGMYIRVSKSAVKYADHPLVYSDHRVGPVSYSVAGVNGASCWDENGYKGAKLNASVTIDSFVDDVSKDYTLVITQKKGRSTDGYCFKSITVGAKARRPLRSTTT